jgi:hypothetical protein
MFNCEQPYLICELIQLFDPPYVAESTITTELVARLAEMKPFEERPDLMAALQRDLPAYVSAASGFSIDHGDVDDFTERILDWWNSQASEIGAWGDAALIAFAIAPNSAGAERVFSLLKILLGNNQNTALADYTGGSMMLRYNNTKRASEACK